MCKFNSPTLLQTLSVIVLFVCLLQVNVNAASITSTSSTCNSSNCTLREWLVTLQEEAFSVECTLSQLEISTALLSKVNYSTTSMRLNQIRKLKKTLSNLKGEIEIINLTCSTFDGPYCNETTTKCNSKCISCASASDCSVCSGNWDGSTCSVCKSGWNGTLCNTPICDSKCLNCTSPRICSNCTGNWNGTTCSVCKSGWNGNDCNTPICRLNCASCSKPNVCSTCKSGWFGSDCSSNLPPLILTSAQITKFQSTIMSNATLTSSKILFKASRDGFSVSTFHSKCDNKGPTIVIVKSTSGAIFGGYISVSWQSTPTRTTAPDNSAFLFSLVSSTGVERFTKLTFQNSLMYKEGYSINGDNNKEAVFNGATYGPTFGGGHDLFICDNSNTDASNSNLCYTYCDTTMSYGSAQTYLAGSFHFLVEDYEVYSL